MKTLIECLSRNFAEYAKLLTMKESNSLQISKELQVNYRKMMVDVTRKTYYSLVAHQRIVGFSCYSYMKLQVCTVIYYCYYHQTTRVQSGQCRMPLKLQAKYLQCNCLTFQLELDFV